MMKKVVICCIVVICAACILFAVTREPSDKCAGLLNKYETELKVVAEYALSEDARRYSPEDSVNDCYKDYSLPEDVEHCMELYFSKIWNGEIKVVTDTHPQFLNDLRSQADKSIVMFYVCDHPYSKDDETGNYMYETFYLCYAHMELNEVKRILYWENDYDYIATPLRGNWYIVTHK